MSSFGKYANYKEGSLFKPSPQMGSWESEGSGERGGGGANRQANEPLTLMLADAAVCAPVERRVQSTPAQLDTIGLPPVETC